MYFAWKLGAADYSRLVIEGEDEVGVRYVRTDKLGLEVAVFYPVTGGEGFRQKMQGTANATLHRDEKKGIEVAKNLVG